MKWHGFESFVDMRAARPLSRHAQQPERMRRVGVFRFSEHDPESEVCIEAFLKQLAKLGWAIGNNIQVDYRSSGLEGRSHKYAAELVALAPDVILAAGNAHVGQLQQITRSIPIVFVQVVDALGAGFVKGLARPGTNATGFTNFSEVDICGKWLELLKQIAPHITRTAVLRNPSVSWAPNWPVSLVLARSLGMVVTPLDLGFDLGSGYASHIEDSIAEFAEKPDGALLVLSNWFTLAHRELIISIASRYRLPAIYSSRYFTTEGGLISYGPDAVHQYRGAASYVDYILKGKKLARLPVQQSTKVALAINLKTAKALSLEVPSTLLASADEVIE